MSLLKDLGPLQLKILEYLAENPENHKQGIQQALQYPAEQYASIHHAVNALEKMEYIKSAEGLSEKKVKIKLYSLTNLGIFFVLTKHKEFDPKVLKILENHRDKYPDVDFLLAKQKEMDPKFFENLYRIAIISLPMALSKNKDISRQLIFQLIDSVDDSETEEFIKSSLKYFPETRVKLKKLRDILTELLDS
jgi:hypothetical protein